MTKFLANSFLILAGMLLSLANYWYTFGLWPKSWISFWLCTFGMILLLGFRMQAEKEK